MDSETIQDLRDRHERVRLERDIRRLQSRAGFLTWNWSIAGPIVAVVVPIVAAVVWSTWQEARTATRQLEANLIIEAARTGDPDEALENLKFFLDAGLITDRSGRIADLAAQERTLTLPLVGWDTWRGIDRQALAMSTCLNMVTDPDLPFYSSSGELAADNLLVLVQTCTGPTKRILGAVESHISFENRSGATVGIESDLISGGLMLPGGQTAYLSVQISREAIPSIRQAALTMRPIGGEAVRVEIELLVPDGVVYR